MPRMRAGRDGDLERCLIGFGQTGGPGMLSVLYNNNYQFVQTKTHMMILVEMAHDVRAVPIFASAEEARKNHRPDAIKPWLGDTVGWWEGDTFVMETININPLQAENQSFLLSGRRHREAHADRAEGHLLRVLGQ